MKKPPNGRKAPKSSRNIAHPALLKAIEIVGGVTNLSLEIGVPHSNISSWLYGDRDIPPKYVPKIVEATNWKVKPEELRPDVYVIKKKD